LPRIIARNAYLMKIYAFRTSFGGKIPWEANSKTTEYWMVIFYRHWSDILRNWRHGAFIFSGCSWVMWLTCRLNWTPVHLRRWEFIRRRRPLARLQPEPLVTLNIEYPIQQPNLS
jgi:hypothetical protein